MCWWGLKEPENGREVCWGLLVNARGSLGVYGGNASRLCDWSIKSALHSGTGHPWGAFLVRWQDPFVRSDDDDELLNAGGVLIETLTLLRRFTTTIREGQWRLCSES